MTLDDIINAKITNALFAAQITSASVGHVNYVYDISGMGAMGGGEIAANFEAIIDELIDNKIKDLQAEAKTSTAGTDDAGISPLTILQGAAKGTGGANAIRGQIMSMIPYLGPIMVATGVALFLFDWARSAGGPLDLRYQRQLIDESFSHLSRQLQRDTEIGNRQIIIQASANFKNLGGAGNSNSLRQIRDGGDRLAGVGLKITDTATGLERRTL